jgi:Alpha amylase, catalytic domain
MQPLRRFALGAFPSVLLSRLRKNSVFTFPNNLVTFFDSQDENRLYGNITTDKNRLHEALAFLITCRGIPNIFYGDEQ